MDDPGAFDRSLMELQVFKEVFCGPTDTQPPTTADPLMTTLAAAVHQDHAHPHGPDLDAAAPHGFMGYLQPDQQHSSAATTILATTLLSDPLFASLAPGSAAALPPFTYDQGQGDVNADTTLNDLSDFPGVVQHHPFYSEQAHGTPALPQQSQLWFSPTQFNEIEAICQNGTLDVNVSTLQSGSAAAVSKKSLGSDIPDQLEAHAHHLFKDAGWTIKLWKRNDRAKMASYFTAPNREAVHTSLTQAWKFCGNKLYRASTDSERGRYPKELSDVDAFWKDLIDTMAYLIGCLQTRKMHSRFFSAGRFGTLL
ncbi:hypothetical protein HU200_057461 [Digitaria exilis]|uniref:Uncharacterized protein n=1 Tax=Digitaria exilis TaxID=1010633 RepID=A0A835E2X1_9POAL|nr:hypothetical protein HU200_057461 [Digitaria exilis]